MAQFLNPLQIQVRPVRGTQCKNRWTNVFVENSLRLLYEVSQDNGSGGYLDITRQIQLLVPQLARISSQLHLRTVHWMNLKILSSILSSLLNVGILYLNPFWWYHACSVWCKKPFISYNIISAIMIILYKCTKIIFIKIVNYQGSCWYVEDLGWT